MVNLIQNNIGAICDACKKHHVRSLYLFGSAAKDGQSSEESDMDLLYRFNKKDIAEMDYADNFFDLLFELEGLLKRKVDLVAEEKMRNPYFIESVNRDKVLLYTS
ncbi:MAG: nucleotidyltransferase domain-containing protein [Bacteroidota bacterium]